jgi:hypothetical protein
MLSTVGGYGITWDEQFQSAYGEQVIAWYRSGFHNDAALVYRDLYLYGGLFDVIAQLVARVSPLDLFVDRHIVNVAFCADRPGGHLASRRRGSWSSRRLPGDGTDGAHADVLRHGFNNPKDIPFAALFVWTLCFLLESTRSIPDIGGPPLQRLTAAFGTLLAIRPEESSSSATSVCGGSCRMFAAGTSPRAAIRKIVVPLAAVLGGAWLIMLAFWPWGQVNPILNPLLGIRRAARFSFTWTHAVLRTASASAAGSLGVRTDVVCLAAAGNLFRGGRPRDFYRWPCDGARRQPTRIVSAPSRLAFSPSSCSFRYWLQYCCDPRCMTPFGNFVRGAAAGGPHRCGARAQPAPADAASLRAAVAAATLAAAVVTVRDMAAMHPYESVYFNRLVAGGLRGVDGRFETDYWGNSYREGIEWVMKNVPGEGIRVANCSNPFQTSYYLLGTEAPASFRFSWNSILTF